MHSLTLLCNTHYIRMKSFPPFNKNSLVFQIYLASWDHFEKLRGIKSCMKTPWHWGYAKYLNYEWIYLHVSVSFLCGRRSFFAGGGVRDPHREDTVRGQLQQKWRTQILHLGGRALHDASHYKANVSSIQQLVQTVSSYAKHLKWGTYL